ncbi:MAG: sulfatase, partial [bacterium]|nr:sulfatase [bacterium]
MNDWTTLFDPSNPIKTPNLERLAERGTFFTRAYCAAPGCNPSRTAIMTGLRPSTSGVYGNRDPWRKMLPDAVTLPQYFMRHGYAASGAGKIFHHGPSGADDPNNPSFQDFFKMVRTRAPKPNYNGYTEDDEAHLARTAWDWGEHTQRMIDLDTVEWVEARLEEPWDRPMFLAAGIFKPHLPFYAPPGTFERYPIGETAMPPMPADDLDDVSEVAREMAHTEFFIYSNVTRQKPGAPGSLQRMVQSYQASADFADQMVGRLIDKLDATGRADNTIIVLWADHGYHLGDKESCVKFTLWEKANHVPFIIVAPGVTTPGTRCDTPVSLLDIYPTLLELAGLPPKRDNDGQSLAPLLRNPEAKREQPAVMTWQRGNHAVRTERWRYIRYHDGSQELYDHTNDPWEWKNL